VQGVERESAPDEEKADQVGMGEALPVNGNGKQEMEGRRYVLEKTDGGEAQPLGGRGEEQERYGGDDAGHRDEQIKPRGGGEEDARPAIMQQDEVDESDRCQQQGLNGETDERLDVERLPDQAVKPERSGQQQ